MAIRSAAVQNPAAKSGQELQETISQQVRVPLDTEQLVHALNEHVRGSGLRVRVRILAEITLWPEQLKHALNAHVGRFRACGL